MINLNIILEEVPNHLMKGLEYEFKDVQESYNLAADATIRADIGRICLDLENNVNNVGLALINSLEMIEDMGLSPFVIEIGVLK